VPVLDPLWRPALTIPAGLARRYGPEHLQAIEPAARARIDASDPRLAWQLLYWNEPDLYDRLTEGEPLHPDLLAALPLDGATVVDVGAGTGRLTLLCAARAARVYAIEPATPMRRILEEKIRARGLTNVDVMPGWCDALPLPDSAVDVVVSASAFASDPRRGGEPGLRELERVVRPGGRIIIVWPDDPEWFIARGFDYQFFAGAFEVRFRDLETALMCAEIFYTENVVSYLRRSQRPVVSFELLGINPPRDACWLDVTKP
jgi:SAM-dependent methyltransferase